MLPLLIFLILNVASIPAADPLPPVELTKEATTNTTKVKRDLYLCGVEPLIFRSEIPCQMHNLCANGGSRMNQKCRSTLDCSNLGTDITCIDAVCCKRPVILGIPTSTQRFYNLAPNSLNLSVYFVLTVVLYLVI